MRLSQLGETLVVRERWNSDQFLRVERSSVFEFRLRDRGRLDREEDTSPVSDAAPVSGSRRDPPFCIGEREGCGGEILKQGYQPPEFPLRLLQDAEQAGLVSIFRTGFDCTTPDMMPAILQVNGRLAVSNGAVV